MACPSIIGTVTPPINPNWPQEFTDTCVDFRFIGKLNPQYIYSSSTTIYGNVWIYWPTDGMLDICSGHTTFLLASSLVQGSFDASGNFDFFVGGINFHEQNFPPWFSGGYRSYGTADRKRHGIIGYIYDSCQNNLQPLSHGGVHVASTGGSRIMCLQNPTPIITWMVGDPSIINFGEIDAVIGGKFVMTAKRSQIPVPGLTLNIEETSSPGGYLETPSPVTADSSGKITVISTCDRAGGFVRACTQDERCCYEFGIDGSFLESEGDILFDGRPNVQVATTRTLMGTWSYSGGFTDGSAIATAKKLAIIVTSEQTGTDDRQARITYIDNNDTTQTVDVNINRATDEVAIVNVLAKDITNVENIVGTTGVSIEIREFSELSGVDVFCYPDTHTFTDLGTFTIGSGFVDGSTGGEYGGKIRGLVTSAINGTCTITVVGTDPNGTSRTWVGTASNLLVNDTFILDISSSVFKPIKNVTNITVSGDAISGAFKIQGDNLVWWGVTNSNGTTTNSVSGGGAPVYTGNYDFEAYKQGYSVQAKTEAAKFCRWYEQLFMNGISGTFSLLTKDNSLLIFYAK